MQNKANFRKDQINISVFTTKDYENKTGFGVLENKAKQSQFQNAIWVKMGKNERESILSLVEVPQHEVSSLLVSEGKPEVPDLGRRTCLTRRNKSLAKSPNGGYKEQLEIWNGSHSDGGP